MRGRRSLPDDPCTGCGEKKEFGDYYANPKAANGRESRCKECCRAKSRKSAIENPTSPQTRTQRAKAYMAKDPDRWRAYQAQWHRNEFRKLREFAIAFYGGLCACCGEKELAFLCIDHINGGGNQHRKTMKTDIYRWLKRQGWPVGDFQVLCHNCNFGKATHGVCPHQGKADAETTIALV